MLDIHMWMNDYTAILSQKDKKERIRLALKFGNIGENWNRVIFRDEKKWN